VERFSRSGRRALSYEISSNRCLRENRTMTERKPADVTFETWIDKQIRLAQERGDFDNLPGTGKPIPNLDKPYDELWWVKSYIHREGLSTEALLPTPLRLRKEIDRLADTVRDLPSEQAVRDVVEDLNLRIVDWLRAPSGPQVHVGPVDADSVVGQWRADRRVAACEPAAGRAARANEAPSPRTRWWRRIVRRHRDSG
jgi:hypothetical protein